MLTRWVVKDDPVMSYRNYYNLGKGYMNRGTGPRWKEEPPLWYSHGGPPLLILTSRPEVSYTTSVI